MKKDKTSKKKEYIKKRNKMNCSSTFITKKRMMRKNNRQRSKNRLKMRLLQNRDSPRCQNSKTKKTLVPNKKAPKRLQFVLVLEQAHVSQDTA